ncbi:MAG TPA: glycosyltransferase [Solirubrobacteraceae bacterium]|nr:glycosyltransferase [Solirubrobacteraceae bacterium]
MRILAVAEYYPRAGDPVLGIWAHRQTLAARDAGAQVRVLVLHRPLPPLRALRSLDLAAARRAIAQPRTVTLDGVRVDYLRYLSPPRPWSYASWGAWVAPVLKRALSRIGAQFQFDLVHAHYAVPAGDAVRRAAPQTPLVVSVHGGDVHGRHAGAAGVRGTLSHARLVLANSAGTARRCEALGARETRVVHLGADLPEPAPRAGPPAPPTLVTVGHLIERKRHADVIVALPALREHHPGIRYIVVGDGPQRDALRALAMSLGVSAQVEFRGQLEHDRAVAVAQAATLFVLPSVAEAFGVSYIEAMAGGVPAIGCRGEDGPEEIAASGGGIELVAPRDPAALATTIEALLSEPGRLAALGHEARLTVERGFTWERCGRETVAAYAHVLGR